MFSSSSPPLRWVVPSPSHSQSLLKSSICPLPIPNHIKILKPSSISKSSIRFSIGKTRATLDESPKAPSPVLVQDEKEEGQLTQEVLESVKVLKNAAKPRKIPAEEILSAFSVLEKAKLDPSGFLETLGGTKSPGRTWMLIFTAEKKLESGKYFPITAVQRFDAAVSLLI
ncbi:hypothetical protein M9H77_29040 [Catharanthus roseus]|uniref:Uncharacterized protein n=1 Tax=Catharanthus roseus TaxID=4058 RepID=A0ACC0AIG8_CATRO|nr:hypothetical protein M9H77_29040 [Catharanthus roseus]